MDLPYTFLQPGRMVAAQLVNGQLCRGEVTAVHGDWLQLAGETGPSLVRLTHVAAIHLDAAALNAREDLVDALRPRPRSAEAPRQAGSRAPGRKWSEDDLRALAEGFIDQRPDAELAERFHRTRGQMKELRQGFECARGNLVEDQISPIAQTWVGRWRKVLGGVQ